VARGVSGHIERLPSGGFRVDVYAGTDPLTGRRLRYRQSVKTEQHAQIVLGRLLEQAEAGRRPVSGVTLAELLARPHRCRPIRQIHAILSGALGVDRPEPGQSARVPRARPLSPASPTPAAVAAVIAAARDAQLDLLAAYVWLAAVTGARRGELCGLQWADIDLDAGVIHIAHSYQARAGQKLRKGTNLPVSCTR
jgi:integrase